MVTWRLVLLTVLVSIVERAAQTPRQRRGPPLAPPSPHLPHQGTPPAQNVIITQELAEKRTLAVEDDCQVRVDSVGPQRRGGTPVSISAPPHCSCRWLVLQVLQRHSVPCSSPHPDCTWRFAHEARGVRQATFLVPVAGEYRAIANCPLYSRDRSLRLAGVDPTRWQVAMRVQRLGLSHVSVRVDRQYSITSGTDSSNNSDSDSISSSSSDDCSEGSGSSRNSNSGSSSSSGSIDGSGDGSGADGCSDGSSSCSSSSDSSSSSGAGGGRGDVGAPFFPRLAVTVREQETLRQVARKKLDAAADGSAQLSLAGLPLSPQRRYHVEVTPADSWICQGANRGCQRRYMAVPEFKSKVMRVLFSQP